MTAPTRVDTLNGPDIQPARRKRPRDQGGGSLYVIEIGTDRVKVGWSGDVSEYQPESAAS